MAKIRLEEEMNPSAITITAIPRGLTQEQFAQESGKVPIRLHRLLEDLAVRTGEELARVATATSLSLPVVREALAGNLPSRFTVRDEAAAWGRR